jgi:hypothetical protein
VATRLPKLRLVNNKTHKKTHMKTQHTPGPWSRLDRPKDSFDDSRILTHITNGAHIVCTLGTTCTDGSPNHSANARLLSAAPDMLEALQAVCDAYGDRDTLLMAQCKAALSKAKGEA